MPPPRQYCLGTEVASSNRWMYSGVLEGFWDAPTPTIITTPTTQVLLNILKVIYIKFVMRWLQVVNPRSKLSQARASRRRNVLKKRPKDKVEHNSLPYLMLVHLSRSRSRTGSRTGASPPPPPPRASSPPPLCGPRRGPRLVLHYCHPHLYNSGIFCCQRWFPLLILLQIDF